jgi:nitrite reductase/ring-hydroxylating ferredoxin subunit
MTHGDSASAELNSSDSEGEQMYAMEASCPHLGADMSHAEIEECETGIVAVCPWHR